jgi:hypothetical protein
MYVSFKVFYALPEIQSGLGSPPNPDISHFASKGYIPEAPSARISRRR